MKKKKTGKKEISQEKAKDDAAYQALFEEISNIVDEARADGIDFFMRMDLFTCSACGVYEDVLHTGEHVLCTRDDERIVEGIPFAVVSEKETKRTLKSGILRFRTTYTYICGMCGAYQSEVFINEFDDV